MLPVRDRVLVVEDDRLTRTMIRTNLVAEGYEVTLAETGEAASALLATQVFDLIILDYMLPGRSGLDVLGALRRDDLVSPVLMLTARSETPLKVSAFHAGADDYLTKPFHVDELLARASALLRRARAPIQTPSGERFGFGASTVDLSARLIFTASGRRERLGDKEIRLIQLFVSRPKVVLRRADILEEVWGMDANPVERTVDNYVGQLRKHVEPEPDTPRHIVTVRGEGYQYLP